MPLPKPRQQEDSDAWIERCMAHPVMGVSYGDPAERAVMCHLAWRGRDGVVKYSEDQPRDEDGKWTDGGGTSSGAQGKPAVAATVSQSDDPDFKKWFEGSKIRDANGNPLVVYHQTSPAAAEAIAREGFRTDLPRARLSDERIPDGVFFKPTQSDIKVGAAENAVQIPVYLSIKNPLVMATEDSGRALKELVRGKDAQYAELDFKMYETDRRYSKIDADMWEQMKGLDRASVSDQSKSREMFRKIEKNVDEWQKVGDTIRGQMRERINAYLIANGHDGVILEHDVGSFNRVTRTIVALRPDQIRLVKK
jgi:hypothetical protein